MKKVLILSGSPRIGGNSDLLCDEFMKGAKESGHSVEKINVAKKNIVSLEDEETDEFIDELKSFRLDL